LENLTADKLKDKTIIMYHMTGDDFIDNQVKKLMEQFLNEHKDEISENYEIIFLKETDLPQ
jgi:hypothetical protein